jgi:hypothetical protein
VKKGEGMKDMQLEIEPRESMTLECSQPTVNGNIGVVVFIHLTAESKLVMGISIESPDDAIQIEIENGIVTEFKKNVN